MSVDESRSPRRRLRRIERIDLPDGPARALRDAIYRVNLEAGAPTLDELAARIAEDATLPGAPKRDVINRIISGRELAAAQQDAVAVALARDTGKDPHHVAARVRDLWVEAAMAGPPASTRLGRPISQCDPLHLEVHRPIEVPGQRFSGMPRYIRRSHDGRLDERSRPPRTEAARSGSHSIMRWPPPGRKGLRGATASPVWALGKASPPSQKEDEQ
jgi:hypothetical protein